MLVTERKFEMRACFKGFAVAWLAGVVVLLLGRWAFCEDVNLLCLYGSEKKAWLTQVTNAFNQSGATTASGNRVVVTIKPMGSGEMMTETLEGRLQPDLLSPASSVWVDQGNADSVRKTGGPLLGPTVSLVQSPVVIAMWKPMAEALGWPDKKLGWRDIYRAASTDHFWAITENPKTHERHPEWGEFKFGHTHPTASSSGLISLIAEAYAAADTREVLTLKHLQSPRVPQQIGAIEGSVVHYGESTGWFGDQMAKYGMGYLSAAVVYENVVVEKNTNRLEGNPPLVAIYPSNGSFMTDHPIGIVQRRYVTDEQRKAAELYIKFLREAPQQERAPIFGFRPAIPPATPEIATRRKAAET